MIEIWLEWARGPVFLMSLAFFALGLARELAVFLWVAYRNHRLAGDRSIEIGRLLGQPLYSLKPAGRGVGSILYMLNSILFHVAVLVVPLFLLGHVVLWEKAIDFGWPALSNPAADLSTLAVLVTTVVFLLFRLGFRTVRDNSRLHDLLILLLVAMPFATGFVLMHPELHFLEFRRIFLIHILSAELLLVSAPLTRLRHMILYPFLPFVSELGWHWPRDAGSRVGLALGHEKVTYE